MYSWKFPSVKSLECKNALGMESGNISDGQLSTSSDWNAPGHADHCRVATTYYADQWDATRYAHQGRLQFKADGVSGELGQQPKITSNNGSRLTWAVILPE